MNFDEWCDSDNHAKIANKGFNAARLGKKKCPYVDGSLECFSWNLGWGNYR